MGPSSPRRPSFSLYIAALLALSPLPSIAAVVEAVPVPRASSWSGVLGGLSPVQIRSLSAGLKVDAASPEVRAALVQVMGNDPAPNVLNEQRLASQIHQAIGIKAAERTADVRRLADAADRRAFVSFDPALGPDIDALNRLRNAIDDDADRAAVRESWAAYHSDKVQAMVAAARKSWDDKADSTSVKASASPLRASGLSRPADSRVGDLELLLGLHRLTPAAVDELFGKGRPHARFLELSDAAFDRLDNEPVVAMIRKNRREPFRSIQAMSVSKDEKNAVLLKTIRAVSGVSEEVPLPAVILRRFTSVIAAAHEATHAFWSKPREPVPRTLREYVADPEEKAAFLNSILAYRFLFPRKSFHDFVREQDGQTKEDFPDLRIDGQLQREPDGHLALERRMWREIDGHLGGRSLGISDFAPIKRRVLSR